MSTKITRAIEEYRERGIGHTGRETILAILSTMTNTAPELIDRLTGRELGLVMSAMARAYDAGLDRDSGLLTELLAAEAGR